jgi:hypothetical protein
MPTACLPVDVLTSDFFYLAKLAKANRCNCKGPGLEGWMHIRKKGMFAGLKTRGSRLDLV